MPLHRIESRERDNDLDVLQHAVQQIEAKGEELVGPADWRFLNYPIGEWLIYTRKAGKERAVSVAHARAEKRAA